MATNTTAVAKQVRLQQWAQQIKDCQNRPVGMKVIDWCDANGIILPKLTTITGLSRFGHSVWNLMEQKKTSFVELPTPTESVNTYNSQTAILDNETVATIHFPSGISVELKQSVPDSLIRTLVEASTYVK